MRARLTELAQIVEAGVAPLVDAAPVIPFDRQAELVALHGWFTDWSDTARACITQRGQLIRLGLAKRRSAKKAATEASAEPMRSSVANSNAA